MLIILSMVAVGIYLTAIQQDLFRRQIPNGLSVGLLVVALVKWVVLRDFSSALWALAIASMVFAVTFVMFLRGWMGGGDVKLMTTSSFFLGAWATYPFLVFTAVAGGFVTLAVLGRNIAVRWLRPAASGGGDHDVRVADATVPYGVAIAAGAIWVMVQQLLLNQQTFLR